MPQRYEMMYILAPNLGDEQLQEQISKYRNMLTDLGATELEMKLLGKRRLAYIIKKNRDNYQEGFYVQLNYSADGKQVAPLERSMRLSDEVLRYLTIKLEALKPEVVEEEEAPESEETEEAA